MGDVIPMVRQCHELDPMPLPRVIKEVYDLAKNRQRGDPLGIRAPCFNGLEVTAGYKPLINEVEVRLWTFDQVDRGSPSLPAFRLGFLRDKSGRTIASFLRPLPNRHWTDPNCSGYGLQPHLKNAVYYICGHLDLPMPYFLEKHWEWDGEKIPYGKISKAKIVLHERGNDEKVKSDDDSSGR